jgi:Glyoxal oxidase N-terminus.
MSARVPETQPDQRGRWMTLPVAMPINPIHLALMHNGKVLVIAGSGKNPDNKRFLAGVWDPVGQTIRTFPVAWDMFCNGMVILPDGRPFVIGGTLKYAVDQVNDYLGERRAAVFDVSTEQFVDTAPMAGGRWYPTGTVLADGSVMVVSGLNETNSQINTSIEIWRGGRWNNGGTLFNGADFYPRQHLLPNGKVFESGVEYGFEVLQSGDPNLDRSGNDQLLLHASLRYVSPAAVDPGK